MPYLSTTSCSFSLSKYNAKRDVSIFPLNNKFSYTDERGNTCVFDNFIEVIKDFFTLHEVAKKDDINKKTFSCLSPDGANFVAGETSEYNYIVIIVASGEYGMVSEITDVDTGKIVHKRKSNQADIKQFYLMIAIPKDTSKVKTQKGLFIFQNIGQFGVKTTTTDYIKEYLKERFNISIHTGNIAPKLYIDKLAKYARLDKLRCINNRVSIDSADNLERGGVYGREERVYSKWFNSEEIWSKVKNFIKDPSHGKNSLFEFDNIAFDGVKVVVNQNGRPRTIDLHNIENLSIIEPLSEEVQLKDGTMITEKLISEMHELAKYYTENLVAQITSEV